MKNLIKNNKNNVIIVSAIMIAIIFILEFTMNNISLIKNSIKIAKAAENETTYAYNNPYIPDGFSFVEGTYNTGYVIQDITSGSQFVWVPVDGTNVKLERKDLITLDETDISVSQCEDELNEKFSESVTKYGGYYVARYEAGIPDGKTFESEDDMDCTGKPVFKKGATIWNNISYTNAKASAEQLYARKSEITSNLMNSYAYDTLLTWIEKSGYRIDGNSKSWGNYKDNNSSNEKVETAGSSENWKANNIYDIAGNVSEWTTERYDEESIISRGGSYINEGSGVPVSIREENSETMIANTLGFRAILYKTGEATIEGYDEPYVPDGFTHTEGEWNTGFVIKETATENEFVWIPVDGYNLKLDRSEFENTFLTMSNCADELDEDFKASVYTYGGYYVGRYEAGVGTTSGNNTGVPVTKKGATVWTNISWTNAKASAEQMYTTNNLNSRLMSSYSYDTMLEWMKLSEYSAQTYDVDNNSTTWGNYRNNGNNTNTNKASAGSNNTWKANNIYDVAGNVWEWTTETTGKEYVARGGDYLSNGDIVPAGTRDHTVANTPSDYTGFRVLLYQDSYIPDNNKKIVKIALGGSSTGAIDEDGNLWMWGSNTNGELGDGTTNNSSIPIKINLEGSNEIGIEAELDLNNSTTILIDKTKKIWLWGSNSTIKLKNGSTSSTNYPQRINSETNFKNISKGDVGLGAIDEDGNLWMWGRNVFGVLGLGNRDVVYAEQTQLKNGTKFKEISLDAGHSGAIDEDGNLWMWGKNTWGQLGDNTTTTRYEPVKIKEGTKFKKIAVGLNHTGAIDEDGNLWMWGSNHDYQLGTSEVGINSKIPVQVCQGTKFKQISITEYNTGAIDEDGNLWMWGDNEYGQIGNGTFSEKELLQKVKEGTKFAQVSVGSNHTGAIDEDGNVWMWGNNNGLLGTNSTQPFVLTPEKVEFPKETE